TRLRQYRLDRQRGAFCDPPLLRQSPHRAGAGRGPRSDRGRGVFGSVAPVRVLGRAHLGAAHLKGEFVLTDVTAFAPATVANVGIGFDIWGHAVDEVGDRVRIRRIDANEVRIRSITGVAGELPVEPKNNTAGRAVQAMHDALSPGFGFELDIEK